jgi:hypothetical protein
MSSTEEEVQMPEAKAIKSGSGHLWSPMRNGGEVKMVPTVTGVERAVVTSRNIIAVGEKVTKKQLDASDEQWAEYVEAGVVRDYPYPNIPAGSTDSPLTFLQKKINQAANSEEERLVAMVTGITASEEELVEEAEEGAKK